MIALHSVHHHGQLVLGAQVRHHSDAARGAGPAQSAHRSGRHVTLVGYRGVEQPQAAVLYSTERSRRVLVGGRRADLDASEDFVRPVARDIDAGLNEKLSQRAATAYLRDELLECRVVELGFEFDR